MRFKKNNWIKVRLNEVCEKANSIDYRKQSGTFNYIDIGAINSELNRIDEIKEIDWSNASSRARQVIYKNDTLFSTVRVNLKRVALVDSEIKNGIASTGFTILRAKENVIDPLYLFYNSIAPRFLDNLVHLQVGTAYPAVTDKMVFNQEIFLPSLPEQIQIGELFQSIETTSHQCDRQEFDLRLLRKNLLNNLTKEKPKFGKLIKGEYNTVQISDVAEEISERVDNPSKSEYEKFVGLEDFETGELKINRYSSTKGLISAMKLFRNGDVLFARRNVYLKRVSQAVFDGVCSGDAIVMRANKKIIVPEFLTLILNTNEFWDYALSNAAGAFSKRIKWRELAVYYFDLPDLEAQVKIIEVFQQIQTMLDQISTQISTLKKFKAKTTK